MASQDDISDLEVDPGQGVHLPQGAQASQASASAAQNPFSPGSPQAQGMYVTPDDMMTMMRQMMEATTAAATAAQAALSAATSQGNAKQGIAGSDMARILPKPDVFKPATREEEHGMWLQWFWSLKQYLCALDSAFGDEIAYLEQHPDEEGQGYKSPEAAQRSKQLFALLCSLVKGRGLQLIQRVPAQSGFEALRQLIQLFQPTSRTRSLGILSAITSMNHFKGNEPLLPQVLDMERIFEEYERSSGKKLDDDFKTSIFLRSITQSMRNHLATILTEDVTYDALREAALRFERMNAKWDARNLFAGDSLFANRRQPAGPNDGPVPMEVDALQRKGNPKGYKGKPKGPKGGGSPKGTKGPKGGNPQGPKSGKPKGKGRGDKGQKGNPKGPDAGKGARQNVICHACGKRGHYKSECWQNVQHVQGDDASTTAPSTAGPSASQVRPSPDTSTTMRSVNMVQIDMTGDWCGGSINALTADSCPAAGDDFLKVVKSLALIPHRYPSLPNLVPVQENDLIAIAEPECTVFAQAIAEPECTVFAQQCGVEVYDMSATDGDEDWTVCDGVLPATATTDACLCTPHYPSSNPATFFVQTVQSTAGQQGGCRDIEIVVDSGSDASCLPLSWGDVGIECANSQENFRDAQGHPITGSKTRMAVLQIGQVQFKERWLLSSVSRPLFSVGKLMKQGWNIIHDEHGVPHLMNPDASLRVPMHYCHNSLHATGMISSVTACDDRGPSVLALEISGPWLALNDRFQEVTSGVYARRDMSDCLLDCTVPLTHLGVQFRTTLRQEASGWAVFELNTPLSSLELSEASFVPSRIHNIITIGSCSKINIDELFGRVPPARRDHVSEDAESDAGLPDVPIGGVGNIAGPDDEIQEGDELPGQEAEEVMQPAMRAHVVVEGVELHEGCTLSTLRAACTALGIGKSGGKATVLQRIHNFMDRQRLLERHQVEDARVQLPREQAPVSEPTPEEVRRHALSHIPFMPWCEHCIKFQARADRHVQARPDVRACSTCSFDFAFTERETGRPGDKLICLILKDSHTGATCAIPTPAKGGTVAFKFMVAEVCKFLNFCGHTEIALRSDGEPACLALQQGVKELRSRMKLDTHLEQLEAADHQANPSEQTVDQLRQLTGTLLSQVEAETGQKVSTMSPLHAWAWKHACWLQMRYGRSGFASPFEVITGRPYNGKVVGFGEVVFARIKSSIKGKARWIKMLWLGKLGVSDLHVGVTPGGFLISSRSVRRLPKQYDASLLESLRDMPWSQASFLAGQVGQARMQRTPVRGEEEEVQQPLPEVVLPERPPLPYPGYVLPDNAPLEELIPPPAIIASGTPEPPTPVQTSAETPLPTAAEPSTPMLVDSDAPPPQQEASGARASSGLGGVSGSSEALGAPGPAPEARPSGAGGDEQPAPKRARIRLRLDAVQVDKDGNELHNVDEQIELFDEAAEGFMDCEESEAWDNYDDDAGASPSAEIPSCLIRPFSQTEPQCSPEELQYIDEIADNFELSRLTNMHVLSEVQSKLEDHRVLSSKSVRSWRPKVLNQEKVWVRRSRLVAREFAWLDKGRSGLFAPTAAQIMLRVVPGLFMRMRDQNWSMLSLDIADAFLQCAQAHPTCTKVGNRWFKLDRMLPGQRDGSVTWFADFTEEIKRAVGAELLPEQPALFRLPESEGGGMVHVDDMMCAGRSDKLEKLENHLKSKFKVSSEWIRNVGDCVSFLKRTHRLVSEDLLVIEPNVKYVEKLMQVTGLAAAKERYKATPFPTGPMPTDRVPDPELDATSASKYRTAVGILMYVASDLPACQFGIRFLSTYAHCPTEGSWKLLRHLTAYINSHESHVVGLAKPIVGKGIIRDCSDNLHTPLSILECFSDADWSGNRQTRKSVSAAVVLWDSMTIYSHSKTQKNISLSSAESEYHSMISAIADSILLKACITFVAPHPPLEITAFCDNSAARTLACRQCEIQQRIMLCS